MIQIKKIIPESIKRIIKNIIQIFKVTRLYLYDYGRFLKYSGATNGDYSNRETLLSAITMDYHRIEKGLSLEETRFLFGMHYIPKLIENMILYKDRYGYHEVLEHSYIALNTYLEYHLKNDIHSVELDNIKTTLKKEDFIDRYDSYNQSCYINCKKEDIINITQLIDFEKFVHSRHSVRIFEPREVEQSIINYCVKMASTTPSVCNRQPWKVYSITGEKVQLALNYQNGNKGFNHYIKTLLIVVGKLSSMRTDIERRQIFIDGGLFSMTLIYSFHSLGIGSCPLNWCVNKSFDKKVRRIIPIKNDEEIIMYLAIGYLRDRFKVTKSPRRVLESFISVVN